MNKKFSLFALACLVVVSQALAEDPRITQGRIFENQGNYEMALGEYRAMLAEDSKNSDAYLAAANVRVKMKDYSGALANFRLAYKFNPQMSAAYEGAAQMFELLGDKKRAEAERAKDPKNNPVVEAPAEEPEAQVEAPKPAEEVKVAEPAPKASEPVEVAAPKKEEPVVEPATAKVTEPAPKAAAEESAPVKAAEAAPVKVAEPAPKATEKAPEAELPTDPFEKGKVLFAEGKYNEAAPLWREVLKKTPGHAGAYFYAGLTRYELGEFDKAEFNLKKGLEYKEEGNDANYYLACIYQKTNKADLEKKFLNNYLKKAAPNGKFRRKAESRLAEMEAIKAEAEAAKVENAKAETAKVEATEDPAKSTQGPASDVAVKVTDLAKVASAQDSKEAESEEAPAAAPVEEISLASAIAKFRSGNLEEALQSYKSLLDTPQSMEEKYFTLLQMGNIYREMRDFHSAVNRYREVVQQFPDSDWATEAEQAMEDAVWLEKHASELPRK